MKKKQKSARALLAKPGDLIQETLDLRKMSQAELAERMGKTTSKINEMIMGKEPITINTALQLEKVFGVDVSVWVEMEKDYRQTLARIEDEEKLECWLPWAQLHPLRELKKRGIIRADTEVGTVKDLLLFYGVVSPDQWKVVYVPGYGNTSYRKSKAHRESIESITSWLRLGETEMAGMQLPEYNKERFKESIAKLRQLVVNHPLRFADLIKKECAMAGVGVVYTESLPGAPISGAARWVAGNPLIQMTDRYKTNDHFWFTFYHEAGHILLHGKKEVFLENVDVEKDEEKENEANGFAEKWLLPEKFMEDVTHPISEQDIRMIAAKYDTHPAIVIGRLQRKGLLPWTFGNRLKVTVNLFGESE